MDGPAPKRFNDHSGSASMLSSNSPLSISLSEEATLRKVRYSVSDVYKMQLAAPIGWLLVIGLVWSRHVSNDVVLWAAGFAVVLAGLLWKLDRMRGGQGSVPHRIGWLHALAALDGLAWGALPFFTFGQDTILDNWLITLLCGIAVLNAPARALIPTAYGAQLGASGSPRRSIARCIGACPAFPRWWQGSRCFSAC